MKINLSTLFIALLFMCAVILSSCSKKSGAIVPYEMLSVSELNTYTDIDIQYPKFSKLDALNSAIEHVVLEERYAEFTATAQEHWQEINAAHKAMGALEDVPPLEYKVICEPIFNGQDYISMLFTTYVYYGGAHGDTLLDSITYDIAAKKIIPITSIPNISLIEIATHCNDKLLQMYNSDEDDAESQKSREDWIAEGTAPEEYNYQVFTFDGTTLTVYFEPYIVAPYAYGVQKVEIPLK